MIDSTKSFMVDIVKCTKRLYSLSSFWGLLSQK